MALKWFDVTIPMPEGMTVWPGDEPYHLTPSARIAQGKSTNVSAIHMSTHCGTHIDAPWHFEDGGKRLHEIPTDWFFGQALLIDCCGLATITAKDLGPAPLPPRILIKTDTSDYPAEAPFNKDYVALQPDAAQRAVDEGVHVLGIDYYSVAPYKQPGQPTHHILLQNDVMIIEGLRLKEFNAGEYAFTVLPLPLVGADGSPCRAFLGRENGHE